MFLFYFFIFSNQINANEDLFQEITPRQTWPTDTRSWPPSFSKFVRISNQNVDYVQNNYVRPVSLFFIFLILSLFVIIAICFHYNKDNKLKRRNNISFSIGEDIGLMEDISESTPPRPKTEL